MFRTYDSDSALFEALKTGEVNFVMVSLIRNIDRIFSNDSVINYHFSDIKYYYYFEGIKDDIFQEVKRNIDYGHDCPGYFLAVGNHIPPNTPISSVEWYQEAYEEYSIR